MQYRFSKRTGNRPYTLLEHPRFRGAYDFLALRALAGDESMELAEWWTTFQDVDEKTQSQMILSQDDAPPPKKPRRRRKPKTEP